MGIDEGVLLTLGDGSLELQLILISLRREGVGKQVATDSER